MFIAIHRLQPFSPESATNRRVGIAHKAQQSEVSKIVGIARPTKNRCNLADVYATIAFYLNHQPEAKAYLQQRQQQSHPSVANQL